jgi:hypothetical protein
MTKTKVYLGLILVGTLLIGKVLAAPTPPPAPDPSPATTNTTTTNNLN